MRAVIAITLIALTSACAGTADQPEAMATANLDSRSGSQVRGTVTFTQVGADIVRVSGEISGHSRGPKGFHVHEKGVAKFNFVVGGISVSNKSDGVIGRSVIVHAAADDLVTDPTGNSGGRVAFGIIR